MAIVNRENVEIACEAVAARGEKVTGLSVRTELGLMFAAESGGRPFGSPNTVLGFMNAWKDAKRQQSYQKQRAEEAAESTTEAAADTEAAELNVEIADAISRLSSLIAAANNNTIKTERADAASRIDAVRVSAARDIAAVRAAADEQIVEIQERANQQVEEARSAEIDATNQIEQLEIRVQQMLVDNAAVAAQLDAMTEERNKVKDQLALAIAQRDTMHSEVQRLRPFEAEAAAQKMRADDFENKLKEAESDYEKLSVSAKELLVSNATTNQICEQQRAELSRSKKEKAGLENNINEFRRAVYEMSEAHKLEIVSVRAETNATIELLQSAVAAMQSSKVS